MSAQHVDPAAALAVVLQQDLLEVGLGTGAGGFTHEQELWVFVSRDDIRSPGELAAAQEVVGASPPPDVSSINYVLIHWDPRAAASGGADVPERVPVALGRSAVSLAFALRKLLDLPGTFERTQLGLINEALSPLNALGTLPINMKLVDSSGLAYPNAAEQLSTLISGEAGSGHGLNFIEAEAGRGKTILLASQAHQMWLRWRGKLPIYIPLRKLPLESGVGWENITQLIGIVGDAAERLSRAVKEGLVVLLLDGIDEVSGRYDKSLVRDLLNLIAGRLSSARSSVVLSGRKTEARHLNPHEWGIFSVELPDLATEDFRAYVGSVVDGMLEQQAGSEELPQDYFYLVGNKRADDLVRREQKDIVQWIIEVFPLIAQEPSLFFVQGLAAIAIGRRAGNRAALRLDDRLYVPDVSEVCLVAAVYACLRERTKIDAVAKKEYSVVGQIVALQGLAAIASAPSLANIPTPYELIPNAFHVDPVNAPEVNVAIVRQNAKHALLYASEAVGTYRPQFLSDWIRCALLAQIFQSETPVGGLDRASTLKLAASAARANYTFALLLPTDLRDQRVPAEWIHALKAAIADNVETASANLWSLRAAVGDTQLGVAVESPLPLAEVTDNEFVGFTVGSELSGSDYLLDGSQFVTSTISGVGLTGVSLRGVTFVECALSDVDLTDCEGPVTFTDCTLSAVRIVDIKSTHRPALTFINCSFVGAENSIAQSKPPYGESEYLAAAVFESCTSEVETSALIKGDWVGLNEQMLGIAQAEKAPELTRGEACLRRALRSFFPSHIGATSALQVRPYIRLSALGRGSMPPGSPGQEELQQIFESVGFGTGGRPDHLYAPWSGVIGASASGVALRNELLEFLLDSRNKGATVEKLIAKVEGRFPPHPSPSAQSTDD